MKGAIVLIFAALLLIVFSKVSFSEMQAENAPPFYAMAEKEITPENFNEVKPKILQSIEQRMKRLNEEKACVDGANSADELKKCRPVRPGGPRHKGMQQSPK